MNDYIILASVTILKVHDVVHTVFEIDLIAGSVTLAYKKLSTTVGGVDSLLAINARVNLSSLLHQYYHIRLLTIYLDARVLPVTVATGTAGQEGSAPLHSQLPSFPMIANIS